MTADAARRTATFLFTDVVGSTERWERDATDMRTALDRHEAILRDAVASSGGEVFKTVGDAVHAVFGTASAAVEAAVVGWRALSSEVWPSAPIIVRMAVYTGEAEPVDGDWLGRPLNRCARLLAAANPGQVLVSATTAALAQADLTAGVHLVDLGLYRFRGVELAERVFQVVAPGLVAEFGPLTAAEPQSPVGIAAADDEAGRLPSSLAGHVAPAWSGRSHELEALRAAWADACAHGCRTVLIAGEPGVGKTALAARLASEAAERGALVLHGRCDEDALVPYRAFVESLGQCVSTAGGALLAEHTAAYGGELCTLVPLLARRVPGLQSASSTTPEADRRRFFDAAVGLLAATARGRPVLLVFDDLHWADAGTVGLVRELVQQGLDVPLLLVATYRTTDVERHHPSARLLADLRREPGVTRVALEGLTEQEVGGLLAAIADQPLGDDGEALAASLRSDTGGNPFFIIEVLQHLIETGALSFGGGQWLLDTSTVSIPEGIREVVGRRLDLLGEEVAETLRAAAVIGPVFALKVLADVTGTEEEAALVALETADQSRLVSEVSDVADRWQFSHELVRRTLLDQLSLSRRTRLHRKIGEALERQVPNDLAALALHFAAAAGLGDAGRAIDYAVRAADSAAATTAHGDAARILHQAYEAVDAIGGMEDVARTMLLIRIGSETAKAGDAHAARPYLEKARQLARVLGSAELLSDAALAQTRYAWSIEAETADRQVLSEALASGGLNPVTRARLLAARAKSGAVSTAAFAEKRHEVAEAMAAARETGDIESLGDALLASVWLGMGPDDVSAAPDLIDELLSVARSAERPDWECAAWSAHATRCLILGHYDEAVAGETEQHRISTTSRDPYAAISYSESAMRHACLKGDFAETERLAAEWAALGARLGIDERSTQVGVAAGFVPMWNFQARLDDLDEMLAAMPTDGEWSDVVRLWTAGIRARQGRLDEAAGLLVPSVPTIEHGRNWGCGVHDATMAVVGLNDSLRAAALLEQLRPYRLLDCVWESLQYHGAVVHHMGRLSMVTEDFDDAIDCLEEAELRYEQLNSPPWLVLAHHDLSQALRRRGQPTDRRRAEQLELSVTRDATLLGMTAAL